MATLCTSAAKPILPSPPSAQIAKAKPARCGLQRANLAVRPAWSAAYDQAQRTPPSAWRCRFRSARCGLLSCCRSREHSGLNLPKDCRQCISVPLANIDRSPRKGQELLSLFPVSDMRLVEVRIVELPKRFGVRITKISYEQVIIWIENLIATYNTVSLSRPGVLVILFSRREHRQP